MAQPDSSVTPEKRLLELIEEPGGPKKGAAPAGEKKPGLAHLVQVAVLKEKFETLKVQLDAVMKRYQKSFGIKELNRVLLYVVIVLTVIFLVDFCGGLFGLNKDYVKSIVVPMHKEAEMSPTDQPPIDSAAVSNWDVAKMFIPYGKRLEQAQSTRLVDMIKNLKLTGISYNPTDPKAAFCMIEDVEKNITTFLHEGDPVGLLKVKQILEDRVVLAQGDETVEIR